MAYMGSAAYRLDQPETQHRQEARGSFRVVEGGGLDSHVREGVSGQFLSRLKIFVVCVMAFVAIGGVRVGISAATVSSMRGNIPLETAISSAQSLNADLQVTKSQLSASSRINDIVTQNYGMVDSTNAEIQGSAENAQSGYGR